MTIRNRERLGVVVSGVALVALFGLIAWLVLNAAPGFWFQLFHAMATDDLYPLFRLLMMAMATGLVCALGWFFSPEARWLRQMLLVGILAIAALVAVIEPYMLGANTAFVLSALGFLGGFGYWMGRRLRRFFEPPKTFGSSAWATP